MNDKNLTPFLKWPGGKRWFTNQLLQIVPQNYNQYFEPFLGGGSAFFALQPREATITDVNDELINLYIVMRDNYRELKEHMKTHNDQHCKEYYYKIRSNIPVDKVERAARTLYLNRTCYNGMYRVNLQGYFNVPIGTKTNCVYDIDAFERYAEVLKRATIYQSDFSNVIQQARQGDLVFVDPPYATGKKQGNFIKYNDHLFRWEDQLRLLNDLVQAKERGVFIILTNANYKELQDMYENAGFMVNTAHRSSSISGTSQSRGVVEELVITSLGI